MILCRAEASKEYGLGHLKRCLIIADALKKQDESTTFIIPEDNETALSLIQNAGHGVQTIPAGLNLKDEITHYPEKFSEDRREVFLNGESTTIKAGDKHLP